MTRSSRFRGLAILSALLLAATLSACGDDDSGQQSSSPPAPADPSAGDGEDVTEGEPIVIGVLEDRTGVSKAISGEAVRGLEVAVAAVNNGDLLGWSEGGHTSNQPGIMGRPVELRLEDTQNDPNTSLTKARDLIASGVDALILNVSSGAVLQARIACQEAQIVCISPYGANEAIIEPPDNEYIFVISTTLPQQTTALIEAMEAAGADRIAIARDPAGNTQLQVDDLKAGFSAAGLEVVADEVIPENALDITPQIRSIADSGATGIVNVVNPANDTVTFLRAYQQSDLDIPMFVLGGTMNSPEVWDLASDVIDGALGVDQISPDNEFARTFRERYEREHGDDAPFLSVHVQNLSSLMLLKKAMEDAGSTEGPAVREAMEGITDFPLAMGQDGYTITYTPDDHRGSTMKGLVVLQFKDGSPSVVWPGYQPG